MENTEITKSENQQLTVKSLFGRDDVKTKFQEMLGKRAPQFITSVLQIVSQNKMLANADPLSVYNAAAIAATLDLPINNQLGFAYIIPYNLRQDDGSQKSVAQFQIGYRGFIQLCQRTGQFKTISATPIYEGQIKENNPLTGIVFDFSKKGESVIGYAAYFELLNGFSKTFYMDNEAIKKHGQKYSKTFSSKFGLWNTDFDSMATKTVLKLLLQKYAPLSIEMQKAVVSDQAIINNSETLDVTYIDEGNDQIQYEDLEFMFETNKQLLTDSEQKRGKEILKNQETKEYKKLYTSLINAIEKANGK